jgi:Elongation factor P (EF-P) OB domain
MFPPTALAEEVATFWYGPTVHILPLSLLYVVHLLWQISLKCVNSGSVAQVKPVGSDSFESTWTLIVACKLNAIWLNCVELELHDAQYEYLYHDAENLFLSDPETYEQLAVSKSLIDASFLPYLEGIWV